MVADFIRVIEIYAESMDVPKKAKVSGNRNLSQRTGEGPGDRRPQLEFVNPDSPQIPKAPLWKRGIIPC